MPNDSAQFSLGAQRAPDAMNAKQALAWVKKCGIAVESARATVPSLAQVVVGKPLRGSWWAHPKGNAARARGRVQRAMSDKRPPLTPHPNSVQRRLFRTRSIRSGNAVYRRRNSTKKGEKP